MLFASLRSSALALLALSPLAAADTLFVDANLASGLDDGTSWGDAFQGSNGLQNALAAATSGDEIFVAEGVYQPTQGSSRTVAFALKNGVTIWGSFAGGEVSSDERPAFGTADSILSGDLAGDDGASQFGDNSFHLVTTTGTNATAILDGFVVTGGAATTSGGNRDRGAGILCVGAVSPTVRNCRFVENRCTFGGGAGYVSTGAGPSFVDCSFEDNEGGAFGGAFDIAGGSGVIYDRCTFRGNIADRAGALEIFSSNGIVVNNCLFTGNTSRTSGGGGAIWVGGGGGSSRVRNCTIVGNNSLTNAVAGIRNQGAGGFRAFNTIVWDNSGPGGVQNTGNQINAGTLVFHSIVEGGFAGGTAILNSDPLFTDALSGDFSLSDTSPGIDAGDSTQAWSGSTVDMLGNPRFADVLTVADTGVGPAPVVDIGAYEVESAWLDLGDALAGLSGDPKLVMTGTLEPGSAISFEVSEAAPSALGFLIAGFSPLQAPLKGGVLVPNPDIVKGLPTTPAGTRDIPFTWPSNLPSGFATYYQFWVTDAGGPLGFAATNGVEGVTP